MRLSTYIFAGSCVVATVANADSLQEDLFSKAVAASKCQQTVNNGLLCEYRISDDLWLSIKDVGGSDTVIGFNKSSVDSRLYAIMYFGCIAVVPGKTHPPGYSKEYGVYLSPSNGRVYRTITECKAVR